MAFEKYRGMLKHRHTQLRGKRIHEMRFDSSALKKPHKTIGEELIVFDDPSIPCGKNCIRPKSPQFASQKIRELRFTRVRSEGRAFLLSSER